MPVLSSKTPGRVRRSHHADQICLLSGYFKEQLWFFPCIGSSHLKNCPCSQFQFLVGILKWNKINPCRNYMPMVWRFCRIYVKKATEAKLPAYMPSCFSCVQLFATPWTVPLQAPLSMRILQARILKWIAMPSSRVSSQPEDWTQVSCIAGRFFTIWATREALHIHNHPYVYLDLVLVWSKVLKDVHIHSKLVTVTSF